MSSTRAAPRRLRIARPVLGVIEISVIDDVIASDHRPVLAVRVDWTVPMAGVSGRGGCVSYFRPRPRRKRLLKVRTSLLDV